MPYRQQIKSDARRLIRTGYVPPLAASAVVLLIGFMLERISELVETGSPFFSYYAFSAYLDVVQNLGPDIQSVLDTVPEVLADGAGNSLMGMFFSILVSLFTTVLYGGYYIYCMGIRQGIQMPYATLADGLSAAGKLIWCSILVAIKTYLWSMLFVIPGLVAMYRYRFACYNILTDDSLSASAAIRLSCQQTSGMKISLFMLDLSFIGWYLLSGTLFTVLTKTGLVLPAALVPLAVHMWTLPYITLSDLAYFEYAQFQLGRPPYGGSVPPRSPGGNTPWEL